MEWLKDWFVVMLFLHKQSLPYLKGGNPRFYARLLGRMRSCPDCADVSFLQRAVRRPNLLNRIRKSFSVDSPALIVELPAKRPGRSAAYFALTADGERVAEALVAELSDDAKQAMTSMIITRQAFQLSMR